MIRSAGDLPTKIWEKWHFLPITTQASIVVLQCDNPNTLLTAFNIPANVFGILWDGNYRTTYTWSPSQIIPNAYNST